MTPPAPDARPVFTRAAVLEGARHAAGIPSLVLTAGYIGFGALAAGHGLSFAGTLLSTMLIWALPGQLILIEMHTLGAPFVALLLTVALSAARFLPMMVVLMPLLREARGRPAHYYLAAHLLSMTGWAWTMARFPAMPAERRLAYFFGFTLTLMVAASSATVIGFVAGDLLPPLAKLAFMFMSPMYFLLLLAGGATDARSFLSLACGALVGPLVHLAAPQWSVLAGGLVGGTLAYAAHRLWLRRRD